MNAQTPIQALDDEISSVRSELAAQIDGTLIPLMVRRALARMAMDGLVPSIPIAPPTLTAPSTVPAYVPQGVSARILDLLRAAPGGAMGTKEVNAALPDCKPDTVAKAKTRLRKDGFITSHHRVLTIVPHGEPAEVVTRHRLPANQLSVVLRILRAGPPEGVDTQTIDETAAGDGLSRKQARAARYNLLARKLVVHDIERRAWRLA